MEKKNDELHYPVKGLDVTTEFQEQPADTTPQAANVRAYDSLAGRNRGGSRPGLVKYIPGQIPGGASLIQHLNVIVDPTSPALLTSIDLTGTTMDDPSTGARNPGRRVRVGGSGVQPNRNVATQDAPPPTPLVVSLVQTKVFNYDFDSVRVEPEFDDQPGTNNLLLCFTFTQNAAGGDVTVFSDLGPYTQAGSYSEVEQSGTLLRLGLFYRVSGAISSPDDKVIKVDRAENQVLTVILLEFNNTATSSPLRAVVDANGVFTDPEMSPGLVDVGGAGEFVVAAFFGSSQGPDSGVAGPDFTKVAEEEGGIEGPPEDNDLQAFITLRLGVSTDQTPTATWAGGGQNWCAKGASFKPGQ